MRRLAAALAAGVLITGAALVAGAAPATAACIPTTLPATALRQLADGVPLAGKKVGAGWDLVVLGRVTEVRHKSASYRYRITMQVDSVIGGDLPALYTFFGTSHGSYAFGVGQVYAVPLARRTTAPLTPATELWVDPCDPLVAVTDLAAAHEVVASTKPGYQPSPSPSPAPSSADPASALPLAGTSPAPSAAPVETVRASRLVVPKTIAVGLLVRRGIVALVVVVLLVAIAAATEHWWSHRHFA
ncbi:MAG: hypothetical protein QOG49_843 [Frankiaceae bacterium]|nr:hypothetical protein [Frankiaceae bacterium]